MQIALDKDTNDIIKNPNGGILRVTDGRYVVQALRSKLRTFLGEWVLDPTVGWLSLGLPNDFTDFERNPDLNSIETRAREIILGTAGVLLIESLTATLANREVTITFKAQTTYGVIDLVVPWGINQRIL